MYQHLPLQHPTKFTQIRIFLYENTPTGNPELNLTYIMDYIHEIWITLALYNTMQPMLVSILTVSHGVIWRRIMYVCMYA
jgi:hypothetical protein